MRRTSIGASLRHHARALAPSLLLSLAACSSISRVPQRVVLPAIECTLPTRQCGAFFLVDAQINGAGPFNLVIDTGATNLVLTPRAGRALWPASGHGRITSLRVGPLELQEFTAQTFDLEAIGATLGEPIDGILGFRPFRGLLLTLDYPQREVRVARGALTAGEPGVVPYRADPRPFLPADFGPRSGWMLIDSGAGGGLGLRNLEGLELAAPAVISGASRTVRGAYVDHAARLAGDVRLGPLTLRRPVVSTHDSRSIIGQDVLRHFAWTFDQRRRLVRIAGDRASAVESPPLRATGLAMRVDGTGVVVMAVAPASPAERAGLRAGDRILLIDGQPPADGACERRADRNRESARYTVARGDERFEVVVPLEVLVD